MEKIKNLYDGIWKGTSQGAYLESCARIEVALKLSTEGGKVLDIGCGDGAFLASLKKKNGNPVFGVDVSSVALKKATSKGLKVVKIDFNRGVIPLKDASFDTIICLDVIEHIFEPEDLIKEMNRLLKKGGVATISTPNIRFVECIAEILTKGRFPKTSYDSGSYDGGHIHYFTFADMRKLLETNGFKITVEKGIAHRPFSSIKMSAFRALAKIWETHVEREFFHRGILVKAEKVSP